MRRVLLGTFRHTLWALVYGGVGGGIVAIVAALLLLDSRPDLDPWHEVELDEEFRTDSGVETFRDSRRSKIGYSNGGALAVHYALESLSDPTLARPALLVRLPPDIGITRLATLAVWQERLGRRH